MAKWKNTLDVSDLWQQDEAKTITPHEVAQAIAKRLREIYSNPDDELFTIIEEFTMIGPDDDKDCFNPIMAMLYDWGDEKHRLWIKTDAI